MVLWRNGYAADFFTFVLFYKMIYRKTAREGVSAPSTSLTHINLLEEVKMANVPVTKALSFYKRVTINKKTILEHRMIAELILKRPLKSGEVVHHIDEDKLNNDPANLMVMASKSDHAALHMGVEAVSLGNGTWHCPSKGCENNCILCGGLISRGAKRHCLSCDLKERGSKIIPPKQELIDILMLENFTSIGRRYSVSDNAVRAWCTKYNLPKNSSYWKKARLRE